MLCTVQCFLNQCHQTLSSLSAKGHGETILTPMYAGLGSITNWQLQLQYHNYRPNIIIIYNYNYIRVDFNYVINYNFLITAIVFNNQSVN